MSAAEYTFRIKDSDALVVVIHTSLRLEAVYDHLARTAAYNIIRSSSMTTTVGSDVREEFLKDLR